jgi:hypothetical protein
MKILVLKNKIHSREINKHINSEAITITTKNKKRIGINIRLKYNPLMTISTMNLKEIHQKRIKIIININTIKNSTIVKNILINTMVIMLITLTPLRKIYKHNSQTATNNNAKTIININMIKISPFKIKKNPLDLTLIILPQKTKEYLLIQNTKTNLPNLKVKDTTKMNMIKNLNNRARNIQFNFQERLASSCPVKYKNIEIQQTYNQKYGKKR